MREWPPRPRLARTFFKGHGLGNDYFVFEEGDAWNATEENVARTCDRHRGPGSDGLVVLLAGEGRPRLRMFNPDGSEFERSGNGLRVLAAYLARESRVADDPFEVEVGGDVVRLRVHGSSAGVHDVSCDMGTARVGPDAVGLDPGVLDDQRWLSGPAGAQLRIVPVSIGNPHLVVLSETPTERGLAQIGPYLSTHPKLEHGANVQLAGYQGDRRMRTFVWERGVGPTSASGTSACAVAVAAVEQGILGPGEITVDMPGGRLAVTVSAELAVALRGPVEDVMTGTLELPRLVDS